MGLRELITSDKSGAIALGLAVGLVFLGFGGCCYMNSLGYAKEIEAKQAGKRQTYDVIGEKGRGKEETFYMIDGERAYIEVDGKSVEDLHRKPEAE